MLVLHAVHFVNETPNCVGEAQPLPSQKIGRGTAVGNVPGAWHAALDELNLAPFNGYGGHDRFVRHATPSSAFHILHPPRRAALATSSIGTLVWLVRTPAIIGCGCMR